VAVVAVGAAAASMTSPTEALDAPVVERVLSDGRILESSGLARSGYDDRVLWTHNDSGDLPRLFAVGKDGTTQGVLTLSGVNAVDWEAMSRLRHSDGTSWLYVGDIGDNARLRGEISVHQVEEPRERGDQSVVPTTYRFRYPDGRHDAEALLVHPRSKRIYIVTKNYYGGGIYVAPSSLSTTEVNELTRVADAPRNVTDGAIMYDGRMVLRNYNGAFVSSGPGEALTWFPLPSSMQGESLAVAPGYQTIYVGSEGYRSSVWEVPLPAL
jgi:hypothetical protein